MTLKGKDAEEFADAIDRRNAQVRNEQLAKAIGDAEARGKERFDLEKLEQMCDTSNEGRLAPLEERRTRLEYKYYVEHPEIVSLAAFAHHIEELGRW